MIARLASVCALFFAAVLARAGVVSYEANSGFPEEVDEWNHTPSCDPERWLDAGLLVQHVEPGCGGPPGGAWDSYRRPLDSFEGEPRFFIEWRMRTDGDRTEIPGVAPAFMVAGSSGNTNYHFTIARDQVRLIRDNLLPIVFVDIEPDVFHTHRLELYGAAMYVWYIDGEVIDSGVPEGPYPFFLPVMAWGSEVWFLQNTTEWDYVRYGTIPGNGSGDFTSDAFVDVDDFYFFRECRTNSGPDVDAGPGCRWADMDQDSDVDAQDFALFQLAFTGPE